MTGTMEKPLVRRGKTVTPFHTAGVGSEDERGLKSYRQENNSITALTPSGKVLALGFMYAETRN